MAKQLHTTSTHQFDLHEVFDIALLSPISEYVTWKISNNKWDDYNEFWNATQFSNELVKNEKVWFHTHTIKKKESVVGVVMIVGGKIDSIPGESDYQSPKNGLIIKYFHIVERGQGLGQFWIKSVLFPFYRNLGYDHFSVSTSHPHSFKFYKKLGARHIRSYEKESDNGFLIREVRAYTIDI